MTQSTKDNLYNITFAIAGLLIISLPFWTDITQLQYVTVYIISAGANLIVNPKVHKVKMVEFMDEHLWLYPVLFGVWVAIALAIHYVSTLF